MSRVEGRNDVADNKSEEVARDEVVGKSGFVDSRCGSDDFHG